MNKIHIRRVCVSVASLGICVVTSSCVPLEWVRKGDCCLDVSTVELKLQGAVNLSEVEGQFAGVSERHDAESIIAALPGGDRSHAYWSKDGGESWHRDPVYEEMWESRTSILTPGAILIRPWLLNPASNRVMYRISTSAPGVHVDERSTDGGQSWVETKGLFIGCSIKLSRSIEYHSYHPRDPLTICVTGELPWRKGGYGLFISHDGGDSYTLLFETTDVPRLAFSRSNPDVMYGTHLVAGIVKSTDGGRTWTSVDTEGLTRPPSKVAKESISRDGRSAELPRPTDVYQIAVDPTDSERVYVVTERGVFRSRNGGTTWCVLDTGIWKRGGVRSIAIAPGKPQTLLIGTYRGLFRSTDGGCHWEHLDLEKRIVAGESHSDDVIHNVVNSSRTFFPFLR